eukprot:10392447-Alexandrium_andersonii.AAC.1
MTPTKQAYLGDIRKRKMASSVRSLNCAGPANPRNWSQKIARGAFCVAVSLIPNLAAKRALLEVPRPFCENRTLRGDIH